MFRFVKGCGVNCAELKFRSNSILNHNQLLTSSRNVKSTTDLFSGELSNNTIHKHALSIAPMIDYTNQYQRYFQRMLTKHAVLYTEMIGVSSITRNENPEKYCPANFIAENPVVAQIGGSDPVEMKQAVQWLTKYGTLFGTPNP